MTMRLSTATQNGLLKDKGFKEQFDTGVIEFYTGPQPADPDNAVQGTLLGYVTTDGGAFTPGSATNGLLFDDDPVDGVLNKSPDDDWEFTGIAVGTIGWGRLKGNAADAGAGADSTHYRVDFSVGVSGADLNLANITVAVGTPIAVNAFGVTLPMQR